MGREARCVVRVGERVSEGKALLETDELVFRGDDGLRLKVPLKEMRSVEARDGELHVEALDVGVVFALGPQAERWAQKILNPPSLLDKLGVKMGMRVMVMGVEVEVEDEGFLSHLRERTDGVNVGEASSSARPTSAAGRAGRDDGLELDDGSYDAVFVAVDEPEDLKQLIALKQAIRPSGAVWAVFRKGRRDFNENDVLRGGLAAGLVDVKVVRFSNTHTASKFVIRKTERGR
jgi:hypothetical protein